MTVIAIAERALNSINELRMMDASRMESLPKPLTNDLSQPNSTVFLFLPKHYKHYCFGRVAAIPHCLASNSKNRFRVTINVDTN